MIAYLLFAATMCLSLGVIAMLVGGMFRSRAGLPKGRIVYSDIRTERKPAVALVSDRFQPIGKPDFILSTHDDSELAMS
jgi:hypothetical protein